MVIKTSTVCAVRCPACGKIEFYQLSLFSLGRARRYTLYCDCGAELLTLTAKRGGQCFMQIPCVVCNQHHHFAYHPKELWGGKLTVPCCPDTELEMAYVGPRQEVQKAVEEEEQELQALVDDLEQDEIFINPQVAYDSLSHLQNLMNRGKVSCQCGNRQIELELFPDRLELHCPTCGSVDIIYAETEEDLRCFKKVEEISMAEHGFRYLDAVGKRNSPRVTKNNK